MDKATYIGKLPATVYWDTLPSYHETSDWGQTWWYGPGGVHIDGIIFERTKDTTNYRIKMTFSGYTPQEVSFSYYTPGMDTYLATDTIPDDIANESIMLLPTTPPPDYELFLHSGWNLISLPLEPENTAIEVVLAPLLEAGVFKTAWGLWHDTFTSYDGPGGASDDLTTLEFGKGYFINVTEDVTLPLYGTLKDKLDPIHIQPKSATEAGWYYIGAPYNGAMIDDLIAPSLEYGTDIGLYKQKDGSALIDSTLLPKTAKLETGVGYSLFTNVDTYFSPAPKAIFDLFEPIEKVLPNRDMKIANVRIKNMGTQSPVYFSVAELSDTGEVIDEWCSGIETENVPLGQCICINANQVARTCNGIIDITCTGEGEIVINKSPGDYYYGIKCWCEGEGIPSTYSKLLTVSTKKLSTKKLSSSIFECLFPRISIGEFTPRITNKNPIPRITCSQNFIYSKHK